MFFSRSTPSGPLRDMSTIRLARNQYSGLKISPPHASLRSPTAIMITVSSSAWGSKQTASVHSHTFKVAVNHLQALQWDLASHRPAKRCP